MEEPKDLQKNSEMIPQWNMVTIEDVFYVVIIFGLIPILLGIAFIFIGYSIFLGIGWSFLYWEPAYSLGIRFLKLPYDPQKFVRLHIPLYRVPILIVKASVVLYLMYWGLRILITQGFCGQSFLC